MTEIISQPASLPINTNEFDALVGYFKKRGFEDVPAREISGIFIKKANDDNIPVFKLVDTLRGLNPIELNTIITQVLNLDRIKSSTIGFKKEVTTDNFDLRNIESLQFIDGKYKEIENIESFTAIRIIRGNYVLEGYVDPEYVE